MIEIMLQFYKELVIDVLKSWVYIYAVGCLLANVLGSVH